MALSGRGFSDEMMALSNWNTPGILDNQLI